MNIPLFDSSRLPQEIDTRTRLAVERVLTRSFYVLGPEVGGFETAFAAYHDVKECITVANGTDALELSLRALDIGAGDEVVTQSNAGGYGNSAIHLVGASPRFVDIKPSDLSFDEEQLSSAITPRTKAIIVCHLYGKAAKIDRICDIAAASNIPVIEDCAQSHGAEYRGRKTGSWGRLACFSFYPTKNLGAIGDGGAILTDDAALSEKLRKLRQYGWGEKYRSEIAGGRNSRLDEIQAAVLFERLEFLEHFNRERRTIARRYLQAFSGLPVDLPELGDDKEHVCHLFVVRISNRENVRAALKASGIQTAVHYPVPDHQQEWMKKLGRASASLPVTEAETERILTLPCFPGMTVEEQDRVIEAFTQALR